MQSTIPVILMPQRVFASKPVYTPEAITASIWNVNPVPLIVLSPN